MIVAAFVAGVVIGGLVVAVLCGGQDTDLEGDIMIAPKPPANPRRKDRG